MLPAERLTADKRPLRTASPLRKGAIVMWNDQKGFGFIRPAGRETAEDDHFVHISAFRKGMPRRPEIGDEVHFRPADLPGKKRASFARLDSLEQVRPPPQPYVLIPKPRSWLTNLLILMPLAFSGYLLLRGRNPIPFFSYAFFSILTMVVYGADKTHAAIRSWRIPEIYLHLLEIMGGWPGALMAQSEFRHKTRKSLYQVVFRGIIFLHLAVWAFYFYWSYQHNSL